MREKQSENAVAPQIKLIKRYLKVKIQEDNVTFRKHDQARSHIYELIKNAVVKGEAQSALVIGPRGNGKTTLINSVIHQLSQETDLASDAVVVRLSGLLHHDEKVALRAITAQMQLENAVDGKVFGTFAEQLIYLISCLTNAVERKCRSMVFLLDDCHMFCGRIQTLLYNLFDVTHSQRAPMCVLGITNRIDVMDLLEKRVKSRFSHRHIFLFPHETRDQASPLEELRGVFLGLLSLPRKGKKRRKSGVTEDVETNIHPVPEHILTHCNVNLKDIHDLDSKFVEDWNAHIKNLSENEKVIDSIEKFCYYTYNEQVFRNILFQTISKLSPTKPYIDINSFTSTIDNTVAPEYRVKQLQSLSVLELSLVISMLHGSELLDYQPLNFEMVYHRYQKFAQSNSSSQTVPRPVILKAFEHLQELEIVVPARGHSESSAVQKEHILHCLAAPAVDIRNAVKTMKALPTEIVHWVDNSIVT